MTRLFAYLDHNVLDRMSKGDPNGIGQLLRRASLTPVFSRENLEEIRRSSGYEEKFLQVLESVEAEHLVPILSENCHYSGKFTVQRVSYLDTYRNYIDNVAPMPAFGYGMTGLLQKFYGGRRDESFGQVLSGGANEIHQLLQDACDDLEGVAELNEHDRLALQKALTAASGVVKEQNQALATLLDSYGSQTVKQFEETTGLGGKVLNNIRSPDVLRKIWTLVEAKLPADRVDLETFFGIKSTPDRDFSQLEKVNAIYHQLNFLGYHRDSTMHKHRRFIASFSDMTHAALASLCSVLISSDEGLVMKAAAAYEYLGLSTQILYYPADSLTVPNRSDLRT